MNLDNSSPPWYATAYRRAVIDMHIPDWDDAFLSRFDAGQYVAMLGKARAQSIVAYAMSHVGLFNYPTKVGRQHRNLEGRQHRPRRSSTAAVRTGSPSSCTTA